MLEIGEGLLGINCAARHRSVDCRKAQPPAPVPRSASVPFRLASLALAALALLPGAAAAATWSAPQAITSSGTAYGPAVAVGSPDVLGIAYARTIHGTQRIEYRRAVSGRFVRIVIVDRLSRDQSPALTYVGPTATVAWIRASHTGRAVALSRVSPRGVVSGPQSLGGAPNQYEPRFPDPAQLLFNTRATSTVTALGSTGKPTVGVRLPRGATFDATVAVLPNGDRLAVWSETGRVYTAREVRGTFKFGAPTRLSDLDGFARDPHVVVTTDGHAVALWRQSGGVRTASLAPAAQAFAVSREVVAPTEAAEGLSAIATTAGDILVTYVSSPGDTPAGPLRALRVDPAGGAASAITTLTPPGERARSATLAVDSSAAWATWTTAGQVRHTIRVSRIDALGHASAPRTLSGRDSAASTEPAFALSLRGRGIVAWATASGRIHAVTRAGL